MRTRILTIQMIVLFLTSSLIYAQETKSVKEKLGRIKGDVEKIIVSTNSGEVVFEGDQAEELMKMMRSKKIHKAMKWVSADGHDFERDSDSNHVMIFKSDKGGKHIIKKLKGDDNVMIFKHGDHDDFNIMQDGKKIKVEVEDENGEKKVTVTTTENGEEKVEVYEGKEADEYLKTMRDEGKMIIDIDVDADSDDFIWIGEDGDVSKIEKNVKVKIEDGVKKVTVTTTENGEEKVEVYEGDEAEKFLESEDGNKTKIKVKSLKDCKHKKIIIKELKKEKEDNN